MLPVPKSMTTKTFAHFFENISMLHVLTEITHGMAIPHMIYIFCANLTFSAECLNSVDYSFLVM
jgi:hypothetical protein